MCVRVYVCARACVLVFSDSTTATRPNTFRTVARRTGWTEPMQPTDRHEIGSFLRGIAERPPRLTRNLVYREVCGEWNRWEQTKS